MKRYEPRERARATEEDLVRYRENLPYLQYSLTMIGEADGIRYTFCAPGVAIGAILNPWVYVATNPVAKNFRRGELLTLEQYVYEQERRRIVRQMISGIAYMRDPGPDYSDAHFFETLEKVVNRTDELRRNLFPIPKTKSQLAIKFVRGVWWLLHQSWMPLSFDSFEEAVQFGERFVLKAKLKRVA